MTQLAAPDRQRRERRPTGLERAHRGAVRGELPIDLVLRRGGKVRTNLRYELAGREGAPLVIVAGGISAGRHVVSSDAFADEGWWEVQRASLSLERFHLLAIDWVGADGTIDLPIDAADQADAIAQLLPALGIRRAAAFIGASYGGMVGMHFAARYANCLGELLAISAPPRTHPYASALRSIQRQILTLGEASADPRTGIAIARALAMLTYRTPEEFEERFDQEPVIADGRVRVAADDYLNAQGLRHCRRMSAVAYRRLSESIDLHRISAREILVPASFVAVDTDGLVPPFDIAALAASVPGARLHSIASRYGHDAFLKEAGAIASILTHFLSGLEQA